MQKCRKLMSVLLALTMIFSLLPTYALASESMQVTIGGGTVKAGETVTVDISVTNNPGFANMSFYIEYDKNRLRLEEITGGTLFGDVTANVNNGFINVAKTNDVSGNGTIATLTFRALSSATSGETTISLKEDPNADGTFVNVNEESLVYNTVPGTITVNGSTADRTVKFMNGTAEAATATVANGGTLSSIPDAPAAADGQSFLGWYAVSGTDYLLDNVEETITGTEASTQTAITADTTYQAIWASGMIAAGYMTTNGTTSITGISQSGDLQTLVTNCNGGTVKLLQNVILPNNTYLSVASGNTLTLDLNGKTLSGNGSVTQPGYFYVYKGVIDNAGTLSLVSTDVKKGTICLNDQDGRMTERDDVAIIKNNGSMPLLQNIKVEFSSTASAAEIYGFRNEDGWMNDKTSTIGVLSDCDFNTPNCNCAFYSSNDSGGTIGTIQNSSFTGKTTAVSLNYATVEHIQNCNLTATDGTALKLTSGTTVASLTGGDIKGANGIQVEDYYGNTATAFGVLAPTSVEGTNGYALVVGGTNTDNNKMTVNLTGGKYKGTEGALKLYTGAMVTYPEGRKLLAGENGWSTLQTGYSVTFLNADGSLLQQITCASGSSVTYTGETPTRAADENYVYTFANKWNTAANGSGTLYTGDTIENVTSDMTLYAQYTTASAKVVTVTVRSGAVGLAGDYASLKEAVTKLNASTGNYTNVVITLNEDAVETSTVEVKKSVTLDLNGHVLTADTAENGITVSGGATLTVKDSSTNGTGVFKHTATRAEKSAILANGSGTVVNIESGTIEATRGNGLKVDGAAFHVSGGTITGGNNGISVATHSASPVCTVSGGKIICKGNGFALNMDDAAIAGSIQLSGGAFMNTVHATELIRNQDKCAFQDSKSLSPSPNTEGFYEVREVGTYMLVLTADNKEQHYNAGETVTVTVSAYGPGSINSFGFTPSYDSDKLELKSVTSANDGNFTVNQETGTSGYTVNGEGITLGGTSDSATKLVTITFTAKGNINDNDTTTITLMDLEMTPSGSETSDKAVVEKELTVNLHDIRVTLTAANGTINGEKNVTLYAKYNEAGLYSDPARETPATVTAAAKDGYRLNNKTGEKLWKCGTAEYADFDAIKGLPFTDRKTFDLQTTKVWTVSFDTNGMVGGSLSAVDPITVDDGTKLSAAGLPTATANTGYAFTGWTAGGTTIEPDAYTVKSDVTLKPVFTVQSYAFTCTQNRSTVSITAGVVGGKATYGKNVTFTVTPNDKHIVKQVSYTVGSSGTAKTIVPENGVYTIPGAEIVGEVVLEITTVPYYAVTFKAGTGIDLTETTLYTFGDGSGFYTNTTFANDEKAEVPTPTAREGYRLANQADEVLWKNANGTGYTAETVKTAVFRADTVLTAQSVKTYKVTFVSADPAMASISGSLTLDAGTTITAIPPVSYTAGYTFKEWRIGETAYASDEALKAVEINSDTTVTLTAKDKSYAATLTGGDAAEITDVTGLTDGQAVHGTAITFKLTAKTGYKVTAVAYQINGGAAVTLTPEDGVYTIPGDAITGPVTLQLTSNETVTVTFAAGANGSVGGGSTAFILDKGGKLTADQLKAVTKTGDAGYIFKEWRIDGATKTEGEILGTTFDANTTVTAIFDHATYSVAAEGTSGVPTTATHGTALTFTPTVNGEIVIGITVKIGETSVPVTKNTDGSYTIAGDAITGNLTITAQTVTGSWSFISKEGYKALSADTQIALLTTGQLASGNYLLDNQGMYWSSQYKAYVKIVNIKETAASLTAKLAFNASEAEQTLSYTGDINGSNTVTPADGGMINDELHSVARLYVLTEKERLEMDVNGDKKVSTEDIMCILRKYVGLD